MKNEEITCPLPPIITVRRVAMDVDIFYYILINLSISDIQLRQRYSWKRFIPWMEFWKFSHSAAYCFNRMNLGCSITACLSAARNNAVRASTVENWSTALRGPSAARARWLILLTFSSFPIQYYTILTSTERGASAAENLVSPRHWDRQYLKGNGIQGSKSYLKYLQPYHQFREAVRKD